MKNISGFHRLAIATCPWLALTLPPVWAQEPTLAEPPRQSDLGSLLESTGSGEAGREAHSTSVQFRRPAVKTAESLTPVSPAAEADSAATPRVADHRPVVQGAVADLAEEADELGEKTEIIRERYANRRIRIEREVTQDASGNYLNHGSWKMWDERGTLVAEGHNFEGLREGMWTRWHAKTDSKLFGEYPYSRLASPFISQAEFKDGLLDGTWTIYDSKQNKISQWSFVNGQREGLSVWWHPNGKKLREINYKNGAIDGEVVEYTDAGLISKRAVFELGRQLVLRTDTYPNGAKKTQGKYLEAPLAVRTPDDWWNAVTATFTNVGKDERLGWVAWYPNGQEQLHGSYKQGKEDGFFVWWYPNGQKSAEGEYRAGLQHGTWVWWHENGQKATEGLYRDGEQFGHWTVWNKQGRVTQASEHNGMIQKSLEASVLPSAAPRLDSASTLSMPEAPRNAVRSGATARAPQLLSPNRGSQR
jgi:antitoxin component YwqK of YwqJK toxin-antitoxin module